MGDKKKILCLDFDGVIHSYTSGWQGPDVIPDPPVPGALDFLLEATKHFEVHILSSRSGYIEGRAAMQTWLMHQMHKEGFVDIGSNLKIEDFVRYVLYWPTEKPSAFVTIDDRALTFTGEWPSMKTLVEFKPWYQLAKENPNDDND